MWLLLLPVVLVSNPKASSQPRIRPKILSFADTILTWSHLQEYEHYSTIDDSATIDELTILSEHTSPAVRYFSLKALANKADPVVLQTLVYHLADTSRIIVGAGDVYGAGTLSWFVANRMMDAYFLRCSTNTIQYQHVQELANDTVVSAAIIGLARYQNPSDIPLLKRRLIQMLFVQGQPPGGRPHYPYYALASIREFPADEFFPILLRARARYQFERVYPQAVVRFRNKKACELIDAILRESKGDNLWKSKVQIVAALLRYPDDCFHTIETSISIDISSYRLAQRWATEE
jgi:hypothetical protein